MVFVSKTRENGSTLFVALIICLTVGIILGGVLKLTASRFQMSARSEDWNAVIPIVDAGVEEALTHLKDDANVAANNWAMMTIGGQKVYTKQRNFPDGSYFFVSIYNADTNNPLIYSQGFIRSPYQTGRYISRTVKVQGTNVPSVFTRAVAANGPVTLVGNTLIDGFDSRMGGYNTTTNRNAIGGIASNSRILGAVNVGNAEIFGPVSTGVGGTVIAAANGAVGDVAWATSRNGIEPGWTDDTMNVAFPTNSPPTSTGSSLPPTTLTNVTSGTYTLSSYDNTVQGNITISGSNVTLYVPGSFSLSGQGYIKLLPGASLKLILGGVATISGGGIINGSGSAANLSILGLTSCTSITYGGTASFAGTVNAPQAALSLSGTVDIYGAFIADTVTISGTPSLHYDSSLATSSGFIAQAWQEL